MRIDHYISELLYTNDCVIIPGLGGFVANTRSAFLNPAQHTFSPPTKKIAFNASLRVNDGLLAHYVSRNGGVSYQEAVNAIQLYVDDVFRLLALGEKIEIQQVGSISLDLEQHIQFEPDASTNFLMDSFGLTTVHSPAIKREAITTSPLKKVSKKEHHQTEAAPKKRQGWRLLELVPAAAVLAILIFNPNVIQKLNTNLGSVIPFDISSSSPEQISTTKKATNYSYFVEKDTATATVDSTIAIDTVTTSAVHAQEETPTVSATASNALTAELNQQLIDAKAKLMQQAFDKEVDAAANDILASEKKSKSTAEAVHTATNAHEKAEIVKEASTTSVGKYNVIGGCFSVEENANKYVAEANAQGLKASVIGKNAKGMWMVSLYTGNSQAEAQSQLASIKAGFQQNAWLFKN
ncbi:MAG TPA: SPOR domain-containing protein [Bacteroidia bacterium]|nr:SPOR domain-containing protein [Bacteroidia bacterium]